MKLDRLSFVAAVICVIGLCGCGAKFASPEETTRALQLQNTLDTRKALVYVMRQDNGGLLVPSLYANSSYIRNMPKHGFLYFYTTPGEVVVESVHYRNNIVPQECTTLLSEEKSNGRPRSAGSSRSGGQISSGDGHCSKWIFSRTSPVTLNAEAGKIYYVEIVFNGPRIDSGQYLTQRDAGAGAQSLKRLRLVPGDAPLVKSIGYDQRMAVENNLWATTKVLATIPAYRQFINQYPDSDHRPEADLWIQNRHAAAQKEYDVARKTNTPGSYRAFLKRFSDSENAPKAYQALSGLIGKEHAPIEGYRSLIVEFPEAAGAVPKEILILLIGPRNFQIVDMLGMKKKGMTENIIAQKIKMSKGMYKDFEMDEIALLHKVGVSDVLIEAMMESTVKAKEAADMQQLKSEQEQLLFEIKKAQAKLEQLQVAQASARAGGGAAGSAGPSAGDAIANCAGQVVALKACDHVPGGSIVQSICRSAAKSKYQCN